MAQSFDRHRAESPGFELDEIGRSIGSSFRLAGSISRTGSSLGSARAGDDEYELQWAAIERLSTFDRVRTAVLDRNGSSSEEQKKKLVDVTKLGAVERRLLIEKLVKHIENDNLRLVMD